MFQFTSNPLRKHLTLKVLILKHLCISEVAILALFQWSVNWDNLLEGSLLVRIKNSNRVLYALSLLGHSATLLSETNRCICCNRSEQPGSHTPLTMKSNSFANPTGSWRGSGEPSVRFLNSVLVQGEKVTAASPRPPTGFSLKGAAGIPRFSSLFGSGFLLLVSPKSQRVVVVVVKVQRREEEEKKRRTWEWVEKARSGVLALSSYRRLLQFDHSLSRFLINFLERRNFI